MGNCTTKPHDPFPEHCNKVNYRKMNRESTQNKRKHQKNMKSSRKISNSISEHKNLSDLSNKPVDLKYEEITLSTNSNPTSRIPVIKSGIRNNREPSLTRMVSSGSNSNSKIPVMTPPANIIPQDSIELMNSPNSKPETEFSSSGSYSNSNNRTNKHRDENLVDNNADMNISSADPIQNHNMTCDSVDAAPGRWNRRSFKDPKNDQKVAVGQDNNLESKDYQKPDNGSINQVTAPNNEINNEVVNTNNLEVIKASRRYCQSIKRPQSLSCESETFIHKYQSTMSANRINPNQSHQNSNAFISESPSSLLSIDHNALVHDISYLKLMLLKLRRYLSKEQSDERGKDEFLLNESLFRPTTPIGTDISSLSRFELEENYQQLLERNNDLERLLQTRERIITRLQNERNSTNQEN